MNEFRVGARSLSESSVTFYVELWTGDGDQTTFQEFIDPPIISVASLGDVIAGRRPSASSLENAISDGIRRNIAELMRVHNDTRVISDPRMTWSALQ